MQHECMSDVAIADDRNDAVVMDLLLHDYTGLWSVDEIALKLGAPLDAEDAIARLAAEGLIHRCGTFVFATRAAAKARALPL